MSNARDITITRMRMRRTRMKQTTFASLTFDAKKKLTRRERFLREMDQVVP